MHSNTQASGHTGRPSLRLRDHDYSRSGAYFVTFRVKKRARILATIDGETAPMTRAGEAVQAAWRALPERFPAIELDVFVVMPDHIHGVLWLNDHGGASPAATVGLSEVVGAFKSLSTRAVNAATGREGPLWQRGFHDRIIRDERELHEVRKYVVENPLRWALRRDPDMVRDEEPAKMHEEMRR